jgi:DNA repair protein RecO
MYDYSETSLVLSILTRDNGRMQALAKGARRAKSVFEGEIDLLAEGQAVFVLRPAGGLHLLTEFDCASRHVGLRAAPGRVTAAHYVAEAAGEASPEGQAHEDIFDLLSSALAALETEEIAATVAHFQVHLLRFSGNMPDLNACIACGAKISGRSANYNFLQRGMLCDECRMQVEPGSRQYVTTIQRPVLTLVSSLARSRLAARRRASIPPALAGDTISFLGHLIAAAFERESKMLQPLLRSIRSANKP